MAWEVLKEAAKFLEAIARLRRRVPMTKEAFEAQLAASHQSAFTIAHVSQLEVVTMVWQSLDRALANGVKFEDFVKDVGPMLHNAWGRPKDTISAHRIKTIFRNAVQTSHSHGRWEQMAHPDVAKIRPFREFSATRDSRTTKICRDCNGTVLPADDPWWNNHVPPLHHQCRSRVRSLRRAQAKRKGVSAKGAEAAPAHGFGSKPVAGKPIGEPDLKQVPAPLREVFLKRTGTAP